MHHPSIKKSLAYPAAYSILPYLLYYLLLGLSLIDVHANGSSGAAFESAISRSSSYLGYDTENASSVGMIHL